MIEDNLRGEGGHFHELAVLLAEGARQHGFHPRLAGHRTFRGGEAVCPSVRVEPCFRVRRMVHWSLGVDGHSLRRRNCDGQPFRDDSPSDGWKIGLRQWWRDATAPRRWKPQRMIQQWAEDFLAILNVWRPTSDDVLLINTADDFVLTALCYALTTLRQPIVLNVHAIFHFAAFDRPIPTRRGHLFGRQVIDMVRRSTPHRVTLHATTDGLTRQLSMLGIAVNSIPYPTRLRGIAGGNTGEGETDAHREAGGHSFAGMTSGNPRTGVHPPAGIDTTAKRRRILMAGLPRVEKGREHLRSVLAKIEHAHLRSGNYQLSLQLPSHRWKRLVPRTLHEICHRALKQTSDDRDHAAANVANDDSALEILPDDLSTGAYHDWLDTADLGLFLYDAARYETRCSGVMLEMMIRGVPVIVPDDCWLADQVRLAGGDGSIGFLYRSIDEVPVVLQRAHQHYDRLRAAAVRHAATIAGRHDCRQTIAAMRLEGEAVGRASPIRRPLAA